MQSKVVAVPVADMRAEPKHGTERTSQVLYGFRVQVREAQDKFVRVISDDSYEGWVAASYLVDETFLSPRQSVVISNFAEFEFATRSGRLILPFGALIAVGGQSEVLRDVRTGEPLKLLTGILRDKDDHANLNPLTLAYQFMSIPYLWGGTSTYGFDCSGLTQAVYRRCGVILPRNSKEQRKVGLEVTLADSQPGDLILFPGHVALHVGSLRILHANRLRGMVTEESLNPRDTDFRSDLAEKIITVRRVGT